MELSKKYLDELTYEINSVVIEVHKHMGPGLLESVYHKCVKHELNLRGIEHKSEMNVPIQYKDMLEITGLRCDFLIENAIILEIKAVSEVVGLFRAQLLNYMKLMKIPKGILVNFNVELLMRGGHETFVNKYFADLP